MNQFRATLARTSLGARVGVAAALGVALAVALSATAAYVTARDALLDQLDQGLLERATAAVSSPLANPEGLASVPTDALGAGDVKIALVFADGRGISTLGQSAAPLFGDAELAVARGDRDQALRTTTLDGERYRVATVPVGRGAALVLAQRTAPTQATLQRLGLVTLVTGLAGVLIALWVGWTVARTALAPVRRLTAAAEHVARTRELDPVPVIGTDELARLGEAFNAMLAALRDAQARQRQLVADAGHELRTPLTSLRTNLDLLAQSDAAGGLDPVDRAQLLADVRAQLEEMSTLVTDLMELSREDVADEALVPLDLADAVRRAAARVRRRAPDVVLSLDLRPWPMQGDVQLLERAVTNLLDNAAKWSPQGGTVEVRLRDGELTVTDEGPGIAPEDLPHVFERFYRSTDARALPGSGLGLAIVAQAARRHGGSVSAEPGRSGAPEGPPGARLVLRLPATDAAESASSTAAGDPQRPHGRLSVSSQPRGTG